MNTRVLLILVCLLFFATLVLAQGSVNIPEECADVSN